MKARSLSTLLMMVSAIIVTLTPKSAHAANFPSLIGAFKTAVRSTLNVLWPQTFQDLGLSDPLRWGLTLLVAGLTACFFMRIVKPPKEGNDMLGKFGAIALALTLIGVLAMMVWRLGVSQVHWFFWTWKFNWFPTLGKFNPNEFITLVVKTVALVAAVLGLWFGGAALLKKLAGVVVGAGKSIWNGVLGSAGSGKETFWRLFGALFLSTVMINNQHVSNAETGYAPSIAFSLFGLLALVFGKTEAGVSFFNQFNEWWGNWRGARKVAKAQAAPAAQAPVVQPAPPPAVQAAPPPATEPTDDELRQFQGRLDELVRELERPYM